MIVYELDHKTNLDKCRSYSKYALSNHNGNISEITKTS